MTNIVQFKPRRTEEDISHLATSIFTFLAGSPDIPPKLLLKAFRLQHPELSLADFVEGFAFAKRVLLFFEKLVVRADDGGVA